MTMPLYLDHHATTPCDPAVVEAMLPWFTHQFGNAASRTHVYGLHAKAATDVARDQIAREGGPTACPRPLTPATDVPGPYKGRGNTNEWGARHADLIKRIMHADFSAIPSITKR